MARVDVLQKIKSVFRRFSGDAKFPEIGEIKEPTIKDVFGVCCGPRLFNKAVELHGDDMSEKSSGQPSEGKKQ
jgi:hypothetical protein